VPRDETHAPDGVAVKTREDKQNIKQKKQSLTKYVKNDSGGRSRKEKRKTGKETDGGG
jgi:hypothetical protein